MKKKKKKVIKKKSVKRKPTSKRKPTRKELVNLLRKSQAKEVQLKDLKKLKDSKFRKEAESESFVTSSDLNPEIRQHTKQAKGTKGEIQSQKNLIKVLHKKNRDIRKNREQLQEEYVFSEPARKKEIEELLKKPDYKEKDIFKERNLLKYLEGKDFQYIVNDGFNKYKLNVSDLKKLWKKGGDASLPILKKMKTDALESIRSYEKMIKKEKKTASKARMKKLRRIKAGLEDKLKHTINKNIEALETGNMKVLDDFNDKGEKAYSLLFKVVGFNIDRVGI